MLLAVTTVAASAQSNIYGKNRSNSYGSSGYGYGTGSNPSSHYVQPHYNLQSGGYTGGHYQTNPNNTQLDNYGARGNFNPYTGGYGTRSPRY
jgi:hypothetical protein